MEGVPDELAAAFAALGGPLVEELRCLNDMPQVKLTEKCIFDRAKPPGTVANERGVVCRLLCCGGQLDVKCNDSAGEMARPTFVEAARRL